jgi:hypothetical protein
MGDFINNTFIVPVALGIPTVPSQFMPLCPEQGIAMEHRNTNGELR